MGTELASLDRVQAALEERPEDRGLDVRPVEARSPQSRLKLFLFKGQHVVVVKEAAVEPVDGVGPEEAALVHGLEEALGHGDEASWILGPDFQHFAEQALGQDLDVLGEHAEQELVGEVGHPLGLVPAIAQTLGKTSKLLGRLLGDMFTGNPGAQALRVRKDPLEDLPHLWLFKVV
ncbi:hypothetical protein D3C86_1141900 [compost metagenome]